MANIDELGTLLDELAKTGNVPGGLPLYLTEFGFETSPPDRRSGVSPADQARFNTLGERMAWTNPRVAAQSQFLLADVGPVKRHKKGSKAYWSTYQSGLFALDGRPKPATYAHALPFLATRAGTDPATKLPSFDLWGQLRFLSNGSADVAQWRPKDTSAPWATVGAPVAIDPLGYFTATRTAPSAVGGAWRALWSPAGGGAGLASRVVAYG